MQLLSLIALSSTQSCQPHGRTSMRSLPHQCCWTWGHSFNLINSVVGHKHQAAMHTLELLLLLEAKLYCISW